MGSKRKAEPGTKGPQTRYNDRSKRTERASLKWRKSERQNRERRSSDTCVRTNP